jgi:hypothetical protein
MILYHGSNVVIEKIDLTKCKPYKDFGAGFYTTPLKEQALAMARRTVKIYREGKPYLSEFSCDDSIFGSSTEKVTPLNIKRFDKPDNEWARFVINNRNQKFSDIQSSDCNADCKYDIVLGPVANDDITALIDVYLSGILSDDALTRELTYRDLSFQVSFHTEKSVAYLQKTGVING